MSFDHQPALDTDYFCAFFGALFGKDEYLFSDEFFAILFDTDGNIESATEYDNQTYLSLILSVLELCLQQTEKDNFNSAKKKNMWIDSDLPKIINSKMRQHGLGYEYNVIEKQFHPYISERIQQNIVRQNYDFLDLITFPGPEQHPAVFLGKAYDHFKKSAWASAMLECRNATKAMQNIVSPNQLSSTRIVAVEKAIKELTQELQNTGAHPTEKITKGRLNSDDINKNLALYTINHTHVTLLYLAQEHLSRSPEKL